MKICLITPLFDPWIVGGAEKYVRSLATELVKKHEIIVITTKGPTPRQQPKSDDNPKIFEIAPKNVDLLYSMIQRSSSIGLAKKFLWHLLSLWNLSSFVQVKKILDKEKPNLVHTNGIKGFSPSLFSAIKHSRIPHVHTLHDYELISPWVILYRKGKAVSQFNILERIYMSCMRKISTSIDAVISPSKFTMDFHTNLGYFKNSRNYIIHHGVKHDKKIQPKKNSEKEFLFIGQIIENKGPQIAVKAFKRLKEKDVKLHIVGRGIYLDALKKIANGDKRIIFHGFVNDEKDLDSIFSRCSYAIIPSIWYETFGLVIIEALSKGLPVIASKIGGIPELVKDGYNGFLFEAGNVNSLHSILENLLSGKATGSNFSKNAISSSEKFLLEEQIKKTIEVYDKIIPMKNQIQP